MTAIATMPKSGIELLVDPTGAYPDAAPEDILSAMGYLSEWLDEGLSLGEDCQTALTTRYVYYTGPSDTSQWVFEPDGSYTYPGDPKTPPMVTLKREHETLHFYHHAFVVVIKSNGDTWMTRMD